MRLIKSLVPAVHWNLHLDILKQTCNLAPATKNTLDKKNTHYPPTDDNVAHMEAH